MFARMMQVGVAVVLVLGLSGCGVDIERFHAEQLQKAEEELRITTDPLRRTYSLGTAAKLNFEAGQTERAVREATELLEIAPSFPKNWNYGNAIHDGHVVLGREAVRIGDLEAARRHLLSAGKTPGSPQLNSFGPNMRLADDLLAKGEREVVLRYFDECRSFWEMQRGRLDVWSSDVNAGRRPDFGANLDY